MTVNCNFVYHMVFYTPDCIVRPVDRREHKGHRWPCSLSIAYLYNDGLNYYAKCPSPIKTITTNLFYKSYHKNESQFKLKLFMRYK